MADKLPSLEELERRIRAATPEQKPGEPLPQAEGLAQAARFGVELLAGIIAGAGLGWLLDRVFGSAPWIMIIGFFLGAAAGFINLKRAGENVDKVD